MLTSVKDVLESDNTKGQRVDYSLSHTGLGELSDATWRAYDRQLSHKFRSQIEFSWHGIYNVNNEHLRRIPINFVR